MLTQERLKEVLSYDSTTGLFIWAVSRGKLKNGATAGYNRPDGYNHIKLDYKYYYTHRLAWLYVYGEFPENEIDHINQNRSDNRISNLREANRQENKHNQSKPNKNNASGYLGVYWNKIEKKWSAQIAINGKDKRLGVFNTAEEASEAYLKAKRKLHTFWVEKTL